MDCVNGGETGSYRRGPKSSRGISRDPGTHMDAESWDGRKDGASSPKRKRDHAQSP